MYANMMRVSSFTSTLAPLPPMPVTSSLPSAFPRFAEPEPEPEPEVTPTGDELQIPVVVHKTPNPLNIFIRPPPNFGARAQLEKEAAVRF